MMFYGFIFMSRKMATDQPRLAHRLRQLKTRHSGPMSGSQGLDPMWLLLFPEGTNASDNGRIKSAQWAEKTGVKDIGASTTPEKYWNVLLSDRVGWNRRLCLRLYLSV